MIPRVYTLQDPSIEQDKREYLFASSIKSLLRQNSASFLLFEINKSNKLRDSLADVAGRNIPRFPEVPLKSYVSIDPLLHYRRSMFFGTN